MQPQLITPTREEALHTLSVVRNFTQVITQRDIHLMKHELYEFLHLHCGFIAHYDLHGFRATYSDPEDFAEVFMRHFDPDHRYCCMRYRSDEEPYKDTGFTKAEIKQAFVRIVTDQKQAIEREVQNNKEKGFFDIYLELKGRFEHDASRDPLFIACPECGRTYVATIAPAGPDNLGDSEDLWCLFCGTRVDQNQPNQTKEVKNHVEQTNPYSA